ncbi:MAG: hypothetical protein ACPGVO_09975, partial [Spirulinaceae cyanobacterium]
NTSIERGQPPQVPAWLTAIPRQLRRWRSFAGAWARLQRQPLWVPSRRLRLSSYLGILVVLGYLSSQRIQIDAAAHTEYQRLLIAQK